MRALRQAAVLALLTLLGLPAWALEEETLAGSATEVVDRAALEDLPSSRNVTVALAGLYEICPPPKPIDDVLGQQERVDFFVTPEALAEISRIEVLRGPNALTFPVDRGSGGAIMSVSLGRNPGSLRALLDRLAKDGKIEDLEADPCREYFPEPGADGCPPADDIMDLIVLALEKEYAGSTGGSGAVQVGPLPPSPVYDPGPRSGDEKGPTFVRTGNDGSFVVPVGDLSGVVQVEATAGCDSKTTAAVVGGAAVTTSGEPPPTTRPRGGTASGSGTTTRPGGTPTTPTPASKPPPPEGLKLCGPDVTDYVLGVMDFMSETYNQWSVSEQNERCQSLFGLRANGAWELSLFSPYDQPQKGDPQTMGAYFFQRFTTHCARPEPCQSSVEFLGHCMPAQVVNYIQWGGVNALCDTETIGSLSHIARDAAIQLLWNRSLSAGYALRGQSAVSHLGKEFIKDHRGLGQKKKHLKGLLDQYFKSFPSEMGFGLEECACKCGEYETPGFENMAWGFKWGGDGTFIERRGKDLAKP